MADKTVHVRVQRHGETAPHKDHNKYGVWQKQLLLYPAAALQILELKAEHYCEVGGGVIEFDFYGTSEWPRCLETSRLLYPTADWHNLQRLKPQFTDDVDWQSTNNFDRQLIEYYNQCDAKDVKYLMGVFFKERPIIQGLQTAPVMAQIEEVVEDLSDGQRALLVTHAPYPQLVKLAIGPGETEYDDNFPKGAFVDLKFEDGVCVECVTVSPPPLKK